MQYVKGIFNFRFQNRAKSQPYILVRGSFFEILVSKLHKKSAVYKSEGENFLKSICGNVCFFPYSEKFFSKMTCRKCFLRIISEGVLLKLRKISRKLPPNRPKFSQWVKGQILQFRKNFTQGVQKSLLFVLTYEGTF